MSPNTSLADDVEIIRRVLAHIDAHTTDEGETWREPVDNYLNPTRYAAEIGLLRSSPSVFVPCAAVPNPGDHVERVAFGVSLFAVRDRERRVRVFRNACRHRGMSLVEGRGCSHALVCRYHGWTYRLDGSLAHVPHGDGFSDLDASARGLVEVTSREIGGLIVIDALEPLAGAEASRDSADRLASLADAIPRQNTLLGAQRLVDVDSTVRAINWKVLIEQFLEGYHIRSTHRDTFFPVQYDNLNVVETFGPNSRITYPYRNIERLRDRPVSTWTADTRVTFVYQLFPNVMVATFPQQVRMFVVDPIDIDHSTITTYSMTAATVEPTHTVDRQTDAAQARSLVDQGVIEDNEMSAGVQQGLHTGANAFLEFGRHESAIGHFHRNLADRLARLPG
jgi:phenylpropionate dioxygenase-like ring-hydroxylating dioxygenase large terminal subunit